jgi:hypothetical protein
LITGKWSRNNGINGIGGQSDFPNIYYTITGGGGVYYGCENGWIMGGGGQRHEINNFIWY